MNVACEQGHVDVVKWFLDHCGVNVNEKNEVKYCSISMI